MVVSKALVSSKPAPARRIASIASSRTRRASSRRTLCTRQRAEGRPGQPEAAFVVSGSGIPLVATSVANDQT